jgi:hypothetical protein
LTSAGCWAPLFAFLADAAKRLAKYTGHKNWGRHSFSSVVPAGQASAIGAQLGAVCLLAIPGIRSEFGSTVDKSGGTVLNALAAKSFAVAKPQNLVAEPIYHQQHFAAPSHNQTL